MLQSTAAPRRTIWRTLLLFAQRQPLGLASVILIIGLITLAVLAPILAPHSPTEFAFQPLTAPGTEAVFGSDDYGRDVLSRVIWAARVSLYIGVLTTALTTATATLIGLISGYAGGWVDLIIQRLVDAVMALPPLLLLMTLMMAFGGAVTNVPIALGLLYGVRASRIVRAEAIRLMKTPMIEAAHSLGGTGVRVMARHLLPNVMPVLLVVASLTWGQAILSEAQLSFLGLGVPLEVASWGGMIARGGHEFLEIAPWMALFPGLALSLTVYACNMLGDSLRDTVDPTLRG